MLVDQCTTAGTRLVATERKHIRASDLDAAARQVGLLLDGRISATINGIKIRLRRIGERAGVSGVHAHRWRHSYAHE